MGRGRFDIFTGLEVGIFSDFFSDLLGVILEVNLAEIFY